MDDLTTDELEAIKRSISFFAALDLVEEEDLTASIKIQNELEKRKGVPRCSH